MLWCHSNTVEYTVLFIIMSIFDLIFPWLFSYSWEPETKANSKLEGQNLEDQNWQLVSYIVDGTDLEIEFMGWPTLCDSKTKVHWTGGTHMGTCYICGAKPNELAKRFCPKFKKPRRSTYKYGIGALHIRSRFFDWVSKYATNKDFRKGRIRC